MGEKWKKQPYRITARGESWEVSLYVDGHRERKSFRWETPNDPVARKKAEEWAISFKADAFRGLIGAKKKHPPLPFRGLAALFLDDLESSTKNAKGAESRSRRTYVYYRDRLALYISPELGDIEAREVRRADIRRYLKKMSDAGLGQDELNKHVQIIKRVFNWGIEQEKVDANPAALLKKEKAPRKVPIRFYTLAEQAVILEKLKGPAYGLMLVAFKAGLRRRELMGMQLSWIHWDANLIEVPFTQQFRDKSKEGRFVPLDPAIRDWLETLGRKAGPVFLTRRSYKSSKGLVRPLRDPRKLLAEIERAVGFHVKLHDCRHSFASVLLGQGVDMRDVQIVLGHASITTTEIYSHHEPEYLEPVRKAMEAARQKVANRHKTATSGEGPPEAATGSAVQKPDQEREGEERPRLGSNQRPTD